MTSPIPASEFTALWRELEELEAAQAAAPGWTGGSALRAERIYALRARLESLGWTPKRPAYSVTYTVPAGCHLVGLYHYSHAARGEDRRGYYAHLILKDGWYDDTGAPLLGTSITGGYFPTAQEAIDDAFSKVLAHIAKINEEIPLRKASTGLPPSASVKKEAEDLLKLLNL